MRRRIAAVTAVLVGIAVISGAAGVASLPARAAAASEPSVTIKAIDREGNAVAVTASLELASSFSQRVTLTSAHASSVADGVYNIAAWVWEPTKKAATLVDREVTITSSQTVILDARSGRPVRFTVNDPTVALAGVLAEPYSPGTQNLASWSGGYAPITGATVYVVPGAMPPGWDLLLQGNLVRHETNETASPVEYQLVKVFENSIPSDLTVAATKAGLAQDHLTVRDFGVGGDSLKFEPIQFGADGGGYGALPSAEFGQQDIRTPTSIDMFFSPGYEWEWTSGAASNDGEGLNPLLSGHTYAQTFNAAAFGPLPVLGPTFYGSRLTLSESLGDCLLVDAANQGVGTMSVGLYSPDPQAWLYEGSKLIEHASGNGANFSATIPAATQTYTLKLEATRKDTPSQNFAHSITALYTFKAAAGDTSVENDSFWPRMIPQGVSERNTAAAGSKTVVPITFDTTSGPIAAHDVLVWASANGGKTWSPLRVTQSGNVWTVTVSNPRAAGWVSLRVQGADSLGFTTLVTAINAYAVS
jgi:hypothetical protein